MKADHFSSMTADQQLDFIDGRLTSGLASESSDLRALGNEVVALLRRSKYRIENKSKPKPELIEKYKALVQRILVETFGIDENGRSVKEAS